MKYALMTWATIFGVSGLAATVAGCDVKTEEQLISEQTSFWEETDDFSDTSSYYIDSSVWISRGDNEMLRLQFQCFRDTGADQPKSVGLVIDSVAGNGDQSKLPRNLNAILYRRDAEPAQIYHRQSNYGSGFTHEAIDLEPLLGYGEPSEIPQQVKFRFVYGLHPTFSQPQTLDELSRADSVDFVFDISDPAPAQFMKACYPGLPGQAPAATIDDAAPADETAV